MSAKILIQLNDIDIYSLTIIKCGRPFLGLPKAFTHFSKHQQKPYVHPIPAPQIALVPPSNPKKGYHAKQWSGVGTSVALQYL